MKNTRVSLIILLLIVAIGAFLRLYRIGDYMTFLGDEGRDALIVKRMIYDGEFTLLGPITSVGLMHLGPIYYYFMAPFLWAFRLDPIGPAIMVAVFSLATIILIWKISEEFFNLRVAMIASLLYALSPLAIIHAHSSWNPNILPFWGLLIIYGLMKVIIKKQFLWSLVVGLSLGIALQLHYIALVYLPVIAFCLILFRRQIKFIKSTVLILTGGLVTFSPFIIFELRHNFINTHTVIQFVTRTGDTKTFTLILFFTRFWDLTVRLFWRLVVIINAEISIIFLFFIFGVCGFIWLKEKDKSKLSALKILIIWYLAGISFLSLYAGTIFDYYLMFAFPLPFLLSAEALSYLSKSFGKYGVILIILALAYFQLRVTPILKPPNRLATQSREISNFILSKVGNSSYNFGMIAAGNSDHAYRYFLEISGNRPWVIKNDVEDPYRETVADQLYVVCEEKICQPLGHPLWEIAGFGRAEIDNEWQVGLFKVFKLSHYQGNEF